MSEIVCDGEFYCQIELQPLENAEFINKQLEEIRGYSKSHQADNVGWTDIYIRSEPNISLSEKKIELTAFENVIKKVAQKFDKVVSGYDDYRQECFNIVAYGTTEVIVFAEHEDGLVKAIWFDYLLENDEIVKTAYHYIRTITDEFDLLFVDWGWKFAVHVQTSTNFWDILTTQAKKIQAL